MSQRVYLGLLFNEPIPTEYHVWVLAERYGWTLEYIESLPLARWHEWLQIEDGKAKAKGSLLNPANRMKQ